MTGKSNGTDTYVFTYTEMLKVETVSQNGQVLHHFTYDASGTRVAERRSDGAVIFFVGEV